jgi:hypothetical protein
MTPPDETGWKIFDYAWAAVGGLLMVVWSMLNNKIRDNKIHHEKELVTAITHLSERIKDTDEEATLQRGHIAKLFDKLEQHSQESFKRHIELMGAINGKVDK